MGEDENMSFSPMAGFEPLERVDLLSPLLCGRCSDDEDDSGRWAMVEPVAVARAAVLLLPLLLPINPDCCCCCCCCCAVKRSNSSSTFFFRSDC